MKMGGILLVLLYFGADGVMLRTRMRTRKSVISIQQNTTEDASPYILDRCTEVKEVFGQAKYIGKEPMTLNTCYTFCSSRKAFYFGVRNGKDCWCGSQYQARIGGSEYCNVPCPGDKKEMCGGVDAVSVYIMGGGPCGDGEGDATGKSDDKNLGEADQALEKAMKEAQKVVDKNNKKYEIKGAKRMDEAKRLLARAKEDIASDKKSDAKKKLKIANKKVKEATRQFDKMKAVGDGPGGREQQAEQDLKMVKKALKDVEKDPSPEGVKKVDKLINQAAAKPVPKRAPVPLNMDSVLKSFEFMGLHGRFLRNEAFKLKAGEIDKDDAYEKIDATFEMMPALLSSADGGVSIRSMEFPDKYLRHRGFELHLDSEQDTELFKTDATFFAVAAKDSSLAGAYLFRSANFPDRYIHLRGSGEAYLDQLTTGKEKEFSFKIVAPMGKRLVSSMASCKKYETTLNDQGAHNGMTVYFDRHNAQCPTGTAMTGWRLGRGGGGKKIKFVYNCCDMSKNVLGECSEESTNLNDGGGDKWPSIYLDRHNVQCKKGTAMTGWRLDRGGTSKKYQIKYNCCKVKPALQKCTDKKTSANDWGHGATVYFDRHNAQCDSGQFMTKWRLQRPSSKEISFSYSCCEAPKIENFEPFPDLKPCEQWDFVGLPNSDLMAIKMGPTTGTKKTEVHTLGKGSNYKSWVLQTGTGLQLSDASHGTEFDFAAMPNGDLMSIMMGPKTGSGKTEVHILSKSSNYAKFALHAATGLQLSDASHGTEWDFAAMPNGDLMCIMMGPKTGSGKTEVHILSKSSNYEKFVLHAATGLQLSNHKQWSFATLPNGDLVCILKGPTTGSKKTEMHVLSKSSNYKNWALQTGTGLALTLDEPGTCLSD